MSYDNKLTKSELETLSKIQKTYKALYYDFKGLCGISYSDVQITALSFFENFKDGFVINKRSCKSYPWQAKISFKGVDFICLIDAFAISEIEKTLNIDLKDKLPNKNEPKYRKGE